MATGARDRLEAARWRRAFFSTRFRRVLKKKRACANYASRFRDDDEASAAEASLARGVCGIATALASAKNVLSLPVRTLVASVTKLNSRRAAFLSCRHSFWLSPFFVLLYFCARSRTFKFEVSLLSFYFCF